MKKFFIRFVLATIVLLAGLFAAAVAINAHDPPQLEPVHQILDRHPQFTDQQKRAFYYVVGLQSGETTAPIEKGKDIYAHFLSLPLSERRQYWHDQVGKSKFWKSSFSGCTHDRDVTCYVSVVRKNPELFKALDDDPADLEAYIHLMEIGASANIFESSKEVPFSGVGMFALNEHRKLYLQMAKWAIDGKVPRVLSMLESSNRYNQDQIATGTLLERMIGEVEIRGNAGFLQDLLKQMPKTRLSPSLVDSFVIPETQPTMTGAMEHELRGFANFVKNVKPSDFTFGDSSDSFFDRTKNAVPYYLFFRYNETLNKYFEITSEEISQRCQSSSPEQDDFCHSANWLEPRGPYRYLENPVGRMIIRLISINFDGRMRKYAENKQIIDSARAKFAKSL